MPRSEAGATRGPSRAVQRPVGADDIAMERSRELHHLEQGDGRDPEQQQAP